MRHVPDAGHSAVDVWVRQTLPLAVAYARSLLRDKVAAEDVAHDCFCRLLRRADIYDLPNDGTKLLYRALTNACINYTQRAKGHLSLDGAASGFTDQKSVDPQEHAKASELEAALERGLAQLSVTQRAAVELKSLGHTLQEIADTLGLTPGNVGVLIHRARETLRTALASFMEP